MSTKRELILQNVKTTLEGITIENGFTNNFTAATVQRWNQAGNSTAMTPCIIINAGTEKITAGPHPYYTAELTVQLDVWYRQDESDTTPSDDHLSSLLADVLKAMLTDETRGGYANDTNYVSNVPFETVDGQPYCGLIIELSIQYEFDPLNP